MTDRRPSIDVHPDLAFSTGRFHEICGESRHMLALWIAARTAGPVIWIAHAGNRDRLNDDGIAPIVDPNRLLYVVPDRKDDLLWCIEECARSGAASLIVGELPRPPGLTPVRRLQLAAQRAHQIGKPALGLILVRGEGGAKGVESRWLVSPAHRGRTERWRMERLYARGLPPRIMHVAWHGDRLAIEPGDDAPAAAAAPATADPNPNPNPNPVASPVPRLAGEPDSMFGNAGATGATGALQWRPQGAPAPALVSRPPVT